MGRQYELAIYTEKVMFVRVWQPRRTHAIYEGVRVERGTHQDKYGE